MDCHQRLPAVGNQRTKAGGWLDMPVAGRPVRCRAPQSENHVDEWIAHTYQAMIETWQREIVPDLLLGRAITFTIHAAPNQPARFDCSQHFRDPGWPALPKPAPATTQHKQ